MTPCWCLAIVLLLYIHKFNILNMKINNKYDIGDKVVYPGADLGNPGIIESTITGVAYYEEDEQEILTYKTEHSYGVREEHVSKSTGKAKKKLIKMMQDKKAEINEQIDNAIKTIEDTKAKELINKLPNEEPNSLSEV